jgi:hypothetical protein
VLALLERPQGDGSDNALGDSGADGPIGDTSNLHADYPLSFSDSYDSDPEDMGLGIGDPQNVCGDDLRCQFFPNPDEALITNRSVANFAGFDGDEASGDWELTLGDSVPNEPTGTWVSWTITIRHAGTLKDCQAGGDFSPFPDVPGAHPFCDEIWWMKDSEISIGFGDGTYRPSIEVTRQAMSAFMARLFGAQLTQCSTPPFPDVPVDHPFCREIKWMNEAGISTGFGDGTYRPSIAVTRQAMSAFMARLAGASLPACSAPPFPDVPVDHPFCKEIRWMKDAGVSTGFGDGTYRPSIAVTRQAMSAFMQRVSSELPLP